MDLLRGVDWGPEAVALHSLNLAEQEHQRWGEIDFVLIGRTGLLVVEVKGGEVACRDGVWHYTDGYGRTVRREKSPLVQAKDGYFALMTNYLEPRIGRDTLARVPTGFCVALAGASRSTLRSVLGGPEFPHALWATREDLRNVDSLRRYLATALAHWRARSANRGDTFSTDQVREMVGFLRPSFDRVQPLSLSMATVRSEQVELTTDQYDCLDHWEGAARILVSGPAGCGKTFIAVELARRAAAQATRVLFVTWTESLAAELRSRELPLGVTVRTCAELVGGSSNDSWDLMIVDEGQLMLTGAILTSLGSQLAGGLEAGRWAWFGDPTFQGIAHPSEASGLSYLRSFANVTPALRQNCRNTPQVIAAVEASSGAPIGHARTKGAGPVVEFLWEDSLEGQARVAGEKMREWLKAGLERRDLVLLLGSDSDGGFVASAERQLDVPVCPWDDRASTPGDSCTWASVEGFRGLESPYVVLARIDSSLSDEALRRQLYLGMSRANVGLAVVADSRAQQRLQSFMSSVSAFSKK